jgi:magnesium transporter
MRGNGVKLGLSPAQLDSLDDLILDNQQCARQAQIYSSVLLGMSEYTMMTAGIDWRVAYALFTVALILLGWLTWAVLVRLVEWPIFTRPASRS